MPRINKNIQSLIARRARRLNHPSLIQPLKRLSTGLRINSGRDTPAGRIASEPLRSNMRAISAAIDNAVLTDTMAAAVEGGLQEISSLLRELDDLVDRTAHEAALSDTEFSDNQSQSDSILQSIHRLADATALGYTLATTMNSLNVSAENVTAAGSAIRDADFALETSRLTRAQILVNSSTTVPQPANSTSHSVLSLLG